MLGRLVELGQVPGAVADPMKNQILALSLAATAGLALLALAKQPSELAEMRDGRGREMPPEEPLHSEGAIEAEVSGDSAVSLPPRRSVAERETLPSTQSSGAAQPASAPNTVEERADGEVSLTFRVPAGAGAGSIHYLHKGDVKIESTILSPGAEEVIVRVSEGHWTAFFKNEFGEAGPGVTFDVAGEEQVVELAAPGSFDVVMKATDWRAGEVLAGVVVEMVRSDLPEALATSAGLELPPSRIISDTSGYIESPGVHYGTYRFTAECPGFEPKEFQLELPGQFADQLATAGKADLGELKMVSLVAFPVQLVGFQDWGGAEGFSIAHTHDGDRVPFDANGMATLDLGWYSTPLYLKWWFPSGGQEAVAYLDGGFPPEGEPWVLDVGEGVDLDVDLRLSDTLLEQIDTSNATLRVTVVTTRGDSLTQGLGASKTGVFTIRGVAGRFAMVEYIAAVDGKEATLGLERVKLEDGRRSSCVLNIDRLPTQLTFVDAAGDPVPEAYLELRGVDSTTGWSFGAPADSNGQLKVAIPPQLPLSMRVMSPDEALLAVDCPVSWTPGLPQITVRLTSAGSCTLNVTNNGAPSSGVRFELFGAHSSNGYRTLVSEDTGRTKPFDIVSGSTGRLRLTSDSLWMAQPFVEVRPGETEVRVYDVGVLTLDPGARARDISHVELGRTLASWIDAGLVSPVAGSSRSFRVPVGRYRMVRDDEIVWDRLLSARETFSVGSTPR